MKCALFVLHKLVISGLQDERAAAEKTLRDEIARLSAEAAEHEQAGTSTTARAEAAEREAKSVQRNLQETSQLLERERQSTVDLQRRLAQAQTDHDVRPSI